MFFIIFLKKQILTISISIHSTILTPDQKLYELKRMQYYPFRIPPDWNDFCCLCLSLSYVRYALVLTSCFILKKKLDLAEDNHCPNEAIFTAQDQPENGAWTLIDCKCFCLFCLFFFFSTFNVIIHTECRTDSCLFENICHCFGDRIIISMFTSQAHVRLSLDKMTNMIGFNCLIYIRKCRFYSLGFGNASLSYKYI